MESKDGYRLVFQWKKVSRETDKGEMLKRVSVEEPIIFAGGVARNSCMHHLLGEALEKDILVPENPQMVGALGAAFLAGGIR